MEHSVIDSYATALPVLFTCLRYSSGDILEFGGGLYSTPLIHAFAIGGRYARTVENDPIWAQFLATIICKVSNTVSHELWATDYGVTPVDDHRWGVVFIDHVADRRALEIERVRPYADLIIAHDTDDAGYCMEPILSTFPYRFDYKGLTPHTTVVSDKISLEWLSDNLLL